MFILADFPPHFVGFYGGFSQKRKWENGMADTKCRKNTQAKIAACFSQATIASLAMP